MIFAACKRNVTHAGRYGQRSLLVIYCAGLGHGASIGLSETAGHRAHGQRRNRGVYFGAGIPPATQSGCAMIGLIIEGVLGFAMESARCKQLKEAYVGPAIDIVRFQGWASPYRLNSQLGLSQRDARFVLLVACQRGLIFQAVNGRFYITPAQPEAAGPIFHEPPSTFRGIAETPSVAPQTKGGRGLTIACGGVAAAIVGFGAWAAVNVAKAPEARALASIPLSAPPLASSSPPALDAQDQALSAALNATPRTAPAKPVHHQPHKHARHHSG